MASEDTITLTSPAGRDLEEEGCRIWTQYTNTEHSPTQECSKMFENSTVNINALRNSCEDMVCCSSECVLTFLYAGDNIQYVNEQSVSCIHFFLYTSLFIKPHKQKSNGVKSQDLGGQLMVLPRPIHLLGKVSLRCCITCRV